MLRILRSHNEFFDDSTGMASSGEANIMRITRGLIRPLPGGLGPVNESRMREIQDLIYLMASAISERTTEGGSIETVTEIVNELISIISDEKKRREAEPIIAEISNVAQLVAAEVLEIRGRRVIRRMLIPAT